MDASKITSYESDLKEVLTSGECEPTNFRNNFHFVRILEDLQSLRKYVDSYFIFIQNKYQYLTHFCF